MKGLSGHDIAGSARGNVSVECQWPQGSQRRVYILNVSGYVVHVQRVSVKSETDYGRTGGLDQPLCKNSCRPLYGAIRSRECNVDAIIRW